jgi:1-acyl-sn-glycerol-3-phosphate acyltransferase
LVHAQPLFPCATAPFLIPCRQHLAAQPVDGLLRLGGWKVEAACPQAAKSVLIAAPHTSNWDLPYTLMLAFVLNLRVYWMGKQSIFRAPFGG